MKQVFLLVVVAMVTFAACKPKENINNTNPSASPLEKKIPDPSAPQEKTSPLDKAPNPSTGWTLPPCRLVDEEDLRKQLKVTGSIAMIPEVGASAQTVTSCTFRWMKANYEKIEVENTKLRDAAAKKGGGTVAQKSVVDVVSVSYTGKYNDAASAVAAINEMITKDRLKKIPSIGDAAAWNPALNQLTIQKGNAIFYVVVDIDVKKNLDYAQGLALAACGRI